MADYFSFDDVLKELDVGEEELKRMVSEGELRAFRDENKMKFRKEDVENLRKGRTTEPTLILPAQDEGGGSGDTILDLDSSIQEVTDDGAGPPVDLPEIAAPAKAGSETQDVTQQLDFSDTDLTVADDAPAADLQPSEPAGEPDETGVSTEPLQLVEEGGETEPLPAAVETQTEDVVAADEAPAPKRRRPRRVAAELTPEQEEAIERRRPHWIWTCFLVMTFLAAAWTGFFVFDLLRIQSGRGDKPTGITQGIAEKVADSFYGDPQWHAEFHFGKYPPNSEPDVMKRKAAWRLTNEEREEVIKGVPLDKSGPSPDAPAPPAPPAAPAAPAAEQKPAEQKPAEATPEPKPEEKKEEKKPEGQPAPAGEAGQAGAGTPPAPPAPTEGTPGADAKPPEGNAPAPGADNPKTP